MSTRKRNDFLDAGPSEDDEWDDYDPEVAADSRTAHLASHKSKRRKLSKTPSDEEDEDDAQSGEDDMPGNSAPKKQIEPSTQKAMNQPSRTSLPASKSTKSKPLKAVSKIKKPSKTGVVYLSRIPPFMRPATVRTLLTPYGPVSQLFLTPEPPATYAARKHHGGNKKRSFIDGWVEFKHKRHAKACVDAINGNIVGGKKGGWYRDDVWNAKYLRGFRWDDLMAGVRQEEREREERVRVGIARDKREREAFMRDLEGSKIEETRRRKRERRAESGDGDVNGTGGQRAGTHSKTGIALKERDLGEQRRFRQSDVKGRLQEGPEQPDEVKRVLSKIF